MLCVRGPKHILPTESIVCWAEHILVATHPCGEDETICYITAFTAEQQADVGSLDQTPNPIGSVNPIIVQSALSILFRISPQIADGRNSLSWQVYTGWKVDHPTSPDHWVPSCQGMYWEYSI